MPWSCNRRLGNTVSRRSSRKTFPWNTQGSGARRSKLRCSVLVGADRLHETQERSLGRVRLRDSRSTRNEWSRNQHALGGNRASKGSLRFQTTGSLYGGSGSGPSEDLSPLLGK